MKGLKAKGIYMTDFYVFSFITAMIKTTQLPRKKRQIKMKGRQVRIWTQELW